MVDITTLTAAGQNHESGFPFQVEAISTADDVEVLKVSVEDREELPIFISTSPEQILCIVYLFKQQEVQQEKLAAMNEAMLASNISMPLSSFAYIEDQYVVYGALSVKSSLEDVLHEIEVLSSNAIEAIEALKDYLK
jgi:uncharacterized protein YjfI (DUF2170 family)